jgi:hypothetical protein
MTDVSPAQKRKFVEEVDDSQENEENKNLNRKHNNLNENNLNIIDDHKISTETFENKIKEINK